jgi:NMD protein affecting ribosome stability and mRNA decay
MQIKDETTVCVRCGSQCRPAVSQDTEARPFKWALHGLCADCAVTQFLLSMEILRLEIEKCGIDILLNPLIQNQFVKIMHTGKSEMLPDEINWRRVVVNWNEPFPKGYEPERIAV